MSNTQQSAVAIHEAGFALLAYVLAVPVRPPALRFGLRVHWSDLMLDGADDGSPEFPERVAQVFHGAYCRRTRRLDRSEL